MVNLILGKAGGYNYLTLSSIPLALFVVLPAFFFVGRILWKQKFHAEFLPLATLGFLLIMIAMPVYIWGSITSIGRVITPIYPLVIMTTVMYPSKIGDFLQKSTLLIGIIAALGLMLSVHPYHLAS
jgi:hypothetical protein